MRNTTPVRRSVILHVSHSGFPGQTYSLFFALLPGSIATALTFHNSLHAEMEMPFQDTHKTLYVEKWAQVSTFHGGIA